MKKKLLVIILIIMIIISIFGYFFFTERNKILKEIARKEALKNDIISHYGKYVNALGEINLYKRENNEYVKKGILGKNQIIELKEIEITHEDIYLPVLTFKDYYVYYKDIKSIENDINNNQRYKKYIPFNENIITNDITFFNDMDGNLVYSFDTSFSLPIIVKDTNKYGVEFNNQLLYIDKKEVKEIIKSQNTTKKNTGSIAVLNYHFFFDNTQEKERKECNQTICLSIQRFKEHLNYIKNNNIFTPTLNEFEMYLDKKIQLPRSVVITIDDGWRTEEARRILDEYELNGTVFLITSWFKEINFLNTFKYVEFHSHGDNLHNKGVCSQGQGGGLQCLDRKKLLDDLALSRSKLNGSKYFCYPFYEYNSYSISVLKEAGFTMSFAGGEYRAYIGIDKYQIPRYVIYSSTSAADIASYIGI